MENICTKIQKNIHYLFGGIKEFGFVIGVKRYYYYETFIRNGKNRDNYIDLVYSYFEKYFQNIIKDYKGKKTLASTEPSSKNVWICWWQGYDKMPELCKMCYSNLQKNIPHGYTVTLVTQDNYSDFVDMPSYIIDRLNSGSLSITQFSDILREALLYYQGGLWIDSSVWTTPGFFRFIDTNLEFWSIKLDHIYKEYMIGQVISECKWSGFFMYGKKGNLVTKFAFDCMCQYFREHSVTLDYFIQNFIIKIGYNNIPAIRTIIDNIPLSNSHLYALWLQLNKPFEQKQWDEMIADTGAFKLSQKARYIDEINGRLTFHGHLKHLYSRDEE